MYDERIPILFLEVDQLPKGALVEWQVVASDGIRVPSFEEQEADFDDDLEVTGELRPIHSHLLGSHQLCLSPNSKTVTIMGCTQTRKHQFLECCF